MPNAGLIGAASSGLSRLRTFASQHDRIAIGLVFIAGAMTVLHKAGVPVPYFAVVFGVSLGIAALLYEMNAATSALRAFWKGRLIGTVGWAFVWAVAFGYSMNQWMGAASENEGAKSNIHKAAYTKSVDTRTMRDQAKRDLDRIEGRLSWMDTAVNGRAVRGIDAAQADLDNAQAHKFWKATDGCKETRGPQTREFCANVASWKAEKALAGERDTLTAELAPAKAAYAKAQQDVSETKVEVSEARNDLVILTRYFGLSEADARTINALGSIIAISLFLSIATMLKELEHLRETTPRVPMLGWLWGAWQRYVLGMDVRTPVSDVVERNEVTNLHYLDLVSAKALSHAKPA